MTDRGTEIERVARAIFARHWSAVPEGSRPAWPGDSGPDYWLWLAEAAISAMSSEDEGRRWQLIETAPVATSFLAAYFCTELGEWVYDVAMLHRDHVCGVNEGAGPFTHWRTLPEPPRTALTPNPCGQGDGVNRASP